MLREYQDEIARLKERLSQMPTSATSNSSGAATSVVNGEDKENILEECRTKAIKESAEIIAKTEAEMEKLRLDSNHSSAALQKKLDDEMKARLGILGCRIIHGLKVRYGRD